MEEFIVQYGLTLVNKGSAATFITSRSSSIIDLTICSPGIMNKIHDWNVNLNYQSSDHRRLEFKLKQVGLEMGKTSFAFKKADWNLFSYKLEQITTSAHVQIWTPEILDQHVTQFNDNIQMALNISCP